MRRWLASLWIRDHRKILFSGASQTGMLTLLPFSHLPLLPVKDTGWCHQAILDTRWRWGWKARPELFNSMDPPVYPWMEGMDFIFYVRGRKIFIVLRPLLFWVFSFTQLNLGLINRSKNQDHQICWTQNARRQQHRVYGVLNGEELVPKISIPSQMDTDKHGQQRDILRYKLTTKRSSVFF